MATRRCQFENKPDVFCYICGCFTLIRQRHNITSFVRRTCSWQTRQEMGPIYCVITTRKRWVTGQKANLRVYLTEFPWPRKNGRIIQLTAIFVLSIQRALARKTDTKSHILVFPQQSHLLCTLMSWQSQYLKDFFHLKMWVVTNSKRLVMKLKKYFQGLAILLMRPHSH